MTKLTETEILVLTAIRSLQPTNSRRVGIFLNKPFSTVNGYLYGIGTNPGLIGRDLATTVSGANTLRLTEAGQQAVKRVAFVNDHEEKRTVVIGEVRRYD